MDRRADGWMNGTERHVNAIEGQ